MNKAFLAVFLVLAFFLAGYYREGEVVILPAIAEIPGAGNSYWETEVSIYNPNTYPVYVGYKFLRSFFPDNLHTSDGGVFPDPLPPRGSLVIPDFLTTVFPGWETYGALLLYGYTEEGEPAAILASARVYSTVYGTERVMGFTEPGLPWYDYGDPRYGSEGLDRILLIGIEENEAYRTNVGVFNPSGDMEEDILFVLKDPLGNSMGERTITLAPWEHRQINRILQWFGVEEGEGYSVEVSVVAYRDVNYESDINQPGIMAYGTKIDNRGNDPVYIEQSFLPPLPIECREGLIQSFPTGLPLLLHP